MEGSRDTSVTSSVSSSTTSSNTWEWTGAVSSPCRRRKFSFCSSSFLLINAWRRRSDEDQLEIPCVVRHLLHDVLGEHRHLLGAGHPGGLGWGRSGRDTRVGQFRELIY